ncbi:class I SAM-dependent methyltransferase [Streptomyces sp. NBC_00582]|uniref:class I SAM-dependent methyltransferase n=1 Tax=Streptomyces sp. NBC_00582 TaxID=2975783 RepID=UPI002E819D26|nr:class I SAM-dependent methyltransferase [Streptomyces sp. NBC_00582]WUB65264.1 class I SAM-dependent methyltransferase [Streptomyces sp. NBC_00582]
MPSRPRPIHDPRRDDCPWCGSKRLRTRLRSPDLRHRRPGTFAVDECRDCAHAFQNPRLTPEGLTLYDGPRDRRSSRRRLRATARVMLPFPEPESWLDVGTGDGHFPLAAKELFAYTAFDGVDPTPRVRRARAAGRLDEAHLGPLTDPGVLSRLRGRYDVVSMLHHLEHTGEPREELAAALVALRPGGHLLLELPDPTSASATVLGKWWHPYDQPRHLHLIPPANLRLELESRGCEIVLTDRRTPHTPYDLSTAVSLYLNRSRLHRAAPFATALASVLDHALAPAVRRTRFSNAYRVIARKPV